MCQSSSTISRDRLTVSDAYELLIAEMTPHDQTAICPSVGGTDVNARRRRAMRAASSPVTGDRAEPVNR